jgi:23S rRNA (cytidine1920-2'-O)/16S rRNA (cytidine1409-2'-O)-methyltransferase
VSSLGKKLNTKKRLDFRMLEKGIETSLFLAKSRVLAGDVVVDDHRIDKPGFMVREDSVIRLKNEKFPYVSRGGLKLEEALRIWPGPVLDAVCIDVGASTGGFTDVLLRCGARQVFAVDVGYNQLAFSLRKDVRVVVCERTHIGRVTLGTFSPAPIIATVDVSFISLERVLPALILHLAVDAYLYLLIKPQFEVNARWVEKGGIVRSEQARVEARDRVLKCAQQLGFKLRGFSISPITGADGNVEYIAALKRELC